MFLALHKLNVGVGAVWEGLLSNPSHVKLRRQSMLTTLRYFTVCVRCSS